MPSGAEPSLGTAQPFCDFKATFYQGYLLCSCVASSKENLPSLLPTLCGQGLPLAVRGLGKAIKVTDRKKGSGLREEKNK